MFNPYSEYDEDIHYFNYVEDKAAMRQEIAELTEKYLADGGEITYLPPAHALLTQPKEYLSH